MKHPEVKNYTPFVGGTRKSSVLLMELIVSVFIFALCSVACVRLFMLAGLASKETTQKTQAVLFAQNAAECFIASDGSARGTAALLMETTHLGQDSGALETDGILRDTRLLYCRISKNGQLISIRTDDQEVSDRSLSTAYLASLTFEENENGLVTMHIDVINTDGNRLYALDLQNYFPKGGSHE